VGEEKVVSLGSSTDEYIAMNNDEKETHGKRDFVGKLRCKLLSVELDTETGITTIEARLTDISKAWEDR
jgi:hypothetical protein